MNEHDPIRTGAHRSGTHSSYWELTTVPPRFPPVTEDLRVDAVIVGGGIAGLTIAYRLVRLGRSVAVVEDGDIGSGETGRTSAHLVSALDDRFSHLCQLCGEEDTRAIAQGHHQAIGDVERIVREEHIDCDFKRLPGYLFLHPSDTEETLVKELHAAVDAGLPVSRVDHVPGITGFGPALRFEDQARFHPLKYLHGLAGAVVRHGGKIFTKSHADEITDKGVVVRGHHINAAHVVVATNSPVVDKYWIHIVQAPYRTYVVGGLVPKGSLPDALWWDTGDQCVNENIPPYHYVRLTSYDSEHDLVLCGGEDHPVGLTSDTHIPEEDRYKALEEWSKVHCGVGEVVQRWSGQVIEPIDSIAYIGRDPFNADNVYIVTGDSGNGLTHATIAGTLIADLITGRPTALEHIYSPSRFSLFKAGKTLLGEFVGGLISYLKNKPKSDELIQLRKGEGRVVELEGKTYGAYKDERGACHMVGTKCTHLQCTVKWNADEQSWDCPCHGSRFTFLGKVLNGPANTPLPYHRLSPDQVERAEEEAMHRRSAT
jgi:glycine/D-amino acid oxidase-like deaminating enzyme/nitrite reductase/ring-hydroxylating ferredoxin subunit